MWYYMNLLFFLIIWFVSSWMWEGWEWSIHWNNRCCKSEIYGSYQQTNNAKELFSESRSKSACACAESWLFTVVTRRSLPWLSTTLVNIKALYMVAPGYAPGSDKQRTTEKQRSVCVYRVLDLGSFHWQLSKNLP